MEGNLCTTDTRFNISMRYIFPRPLVAEVVYQALHAWMNWITSGFELVVSVMLNFSPGLESLFSFLMNMSFSIGKPTKLIRPCLLPQQCDGLTILSEFKRTAYNECICIITAYFVCCQKTNEICLILFISKECLLISVSLCIFSYHNNCCRHISSLAKIVVVTFGWLFFIPTKHHTAQSILCPEKWIVLSQHVCMCSIILPSHEMQQRTAINRKHTIWSKLGCIVWHNIPHVLLKLSCQVQTCLRSSRRSLWREK